MKSVETIENRSIPVNIVGELAHQRAPWRPTRGSTQENGPSYVTSAIIDSAQSIHCSPMFVGTMLTNHSTVRTVTRSSSTVQR